MVSAAQKAPVVAPEVLVPRLGERLVEKGLISQDELSQALTHQRARSQGGEPILLGQAMLELGMIERARLDEAITEQISQLQDALYRSNELLEQRVKDRTAELQEALEKLTELNRLKTDFISNMSHELRTPLAHMVGYIDLLDEEALGSLSKEQRQAVDVLKKSYLRLGGLIDNLLFLSFDTESALDLQLQATPLQVLVPKLVQRLLSKHLGATIRINQEIEQGLPEIWADAEKIDWVLTQLLDNAIKFNRENGQVVLRAKKSGKRIEIAVIDNGIGIPEGKLEEIFEPFYQLDGTSTRKYGGTGLGLTLVKRIVEAHSSKLKVESVLNKGTRMSFSLPIAEN